MTISFPESVMKRPKMYTLGGTYNEVVAFLTGYYSGAAKSNPSVEPSALWFNLRKWLEAKLQSQETNVFLTLRNEYETDELAITALEHYITQYRIEQGVEWWP